MSENILDQKLQSFGVSLHSAILGQLIGEIDGAIEDGRIRIQDGRLSILDFLGSVMQVKATSKTWKRFTDRKIGIQAPSF
jgi:hypothetical protein